MKVAFLFMHPFSESPGSSIRVNKLAAGLGRQGVYCSIINPYEKSRDSAPNVHIMQSSKFIPPLWIRLFAYAVSKHLYYNRLFIVNPSLYIKSQLIFAERMAINLNNILKGRNIQILQVEQDFTIATGLAFKKLTSIPLAADIHNLTPLELLSAGIIRENSKTFQHLNKWMGNMLSQVDLIIAVSEEMKSYMKSEYKLSGEKIIVVPPGAIANRASALNKDGPPRVVYAGLSAYREHIDLFIRSIPYVKAKRPEVKFYMTQKGENFNHLMFLARKVGADISPFWYENPNNFYSFMQTCNVAILPSLNDLARKIGTPLKLFDYMSLGLPVVANDVGAWSEIISKENLGVVTEDTPEAFASGILQLLNNPGFAIGCGHKGKDLVNKQYNWDNSSKILLLGYEKLIRAF